MKLNLLEWNINQRGRYTSDCIYTELKKMININKIDIIILSEFSKNFGHYEKIVKPLEDIGYTVFLDPRPFKKDIRQILIAVKSDLSKEQKMSIYFINDNEGRIYETHDACPNYLRVDLEEYNLSIIGTRIRIRTSGGPKEHIFRQTQLSKLLSNIPLNRNIIMMGDFNIADHDLYKSPRKYWHYETNYKDLLENANLRVYVPERQSSKGAFALDHLIVSERTVVSKDKITYYPSDGKNFDWVNHDNSPDHSMLLAEIEI